MMIGQRYSQSPSRFDSFALRMAKTLWTFHFLSAMGLMPFSQNDNSDCGFLFTSMDKKNFNKVSALAGKNLLI